MYIAPLHTSTMMEPTLLETNSCFPGDGLGSTKHLRKQHTTGMVNYMFVTANSIGSNPLLGALHDSRHYVMCPCQPGPSSYGPP